MPNKLNYRYLVILINFMLLNGCATNYSSQSSHKPRKASKSTMPRVPVKLLPGGGGDNWRYLGTSQDNLLAEEINESSIKTNNGLNSFQDRKTVTDQSKFNYKTLGYNYKYSLSWWQLNCSEKQYSISSTSLYDLYGKLIKTYNFNNDTNSRVDSASIAELQYNYLCLGTNRNIGY